MYSSCDSYLVGKLHVSLVIKAFLGELKIIDYKNPEIISNNASVKWYWHNGQPYLQDLIDIYTQCMDIWKSNGGHKIDFLASFWKYIRECEFSNNKGPWTEEMANVHKFALLQRNHFWYQRFFCKYPLNIRYLRLKDERLFNKDDSPRKITTSKIGSITYEISKPDKEKAKARKKQ